MDSSDLELPHPSETSFEEEAAVLSGNDGEDYHDGHHVDEANELEEQEDKPIKKAKTPKTEEELLFCKYCEFQARNLQVECHGNVNKYNNSKLHTLTLVIPWI